MELLLALIGLVFLIPIITIYSAFSWGYVATIIYSWYILPLFPQLTMFTYLQFAGIMFFIDCFIYKTNIFIKKEYKDETTEWIGLILSPWVVLLTAWIFHLFY